MSAEETIQKALVEKLGFPADKVRVQRARRIWAETTPAAFDEALPRIAKELEFSILCTITGLDEGESLSILYHLARNSGIVLTLKVSVPKANPVWKTVMDVFPGSTFYEREMVDLLGLQVQGLPPGNRYPLTDDWPVGEHPLRKDWQPAGKKVVAT